MTITEDDLAAELRKFHEAHFAPRKEGEFTADDYSKANGVTISQAHDYIKHAMQTGKMTKEGRRYIDGKFWMTYKLVV